MAENYGIVSEDNKIVTITTDGSKERLDVNADVNVQEEPRPGPIRGAFAVDGSNEDLSVDGSVTPVEFDIVANTGKIFFISKLTITLQDSSINFSKFGGIAALANGVQIVVKEGGLAERPLGNPLQTNADFNHEGFEVNVQSSNEDLLTARIFVKNGFQSSVALADADGDYMRITVNDDLTSITKIKILAQGYEVDE